MSPAPARFSPIEGAASGLPSAKQNSIYIPKCLLTSFALQD